METHGIIGFARTLTATLVAAVTMASTAQAHPHVFVDGGVDFVFDGNSTLTSVEVTWLYDAFETLYMLALYDMSLDSNGELSEADRLELVRQRSMWPSDFDGSVHLTTAGKAVLLDWPRDLDAQIIDGRLRVTFKRDLTVPVDLSKVRLDAAFYESTYFFDFTVTKPPMLRNAGDTCASEVFPFDPNSDDKELQAALAKLSREETPEIKHVGAMFADRIAVTCG